MWTLPRARRMPLRYRLLRWLRVNVHALHLRMQGHRRAAQMMRSWEPVDHTAATIRAGKANLRRRYGKNVMGRRG